MAKTNTRYLIVEAAESLFQKHGFKRISVEDVCRRAEISRKTFYDYFGNKTAVVIEVLENLTNAITEKYLVIMQGDNSFCEKMQRVIDMKSESLGRELLDDVFTSKDRSLAEFLERKKIESHQVIVDFYTQAQKQGDFRCDVDIKVMITMQLHLFELLKSDNFRTLFPDETTMLRQISELYLYGIVGKK